MASGTGSLHSVGCSKVICTLSRYVIDPLGAEQEKSGIISSLCSPLSGCLMSTNESVSSGAALCVTAVIQSNNWQFASHQLINDICLKVSGALEEVHCQTISHLGLVVALLKQNRLTLEPYGRSLIRSGLSILDASTKESNSQMITSSIQMVHSIMKSLDLSIISSEISSIIQAMEQLQDDSMSEISTPAFQAAETAKKLCRQEECGYGRRISPLAKHGGRHSRKGSYSHSVMDDAEIRDSGSNESLSDDVQSAHRFRDHDSHPSVGQYSVVTGSARARRRLWSNGSDKSHRIPSDDFTHTVITDYHDGVGVIAHSNSAGLLKSMRRSSDVSTRIADQCPMCLTPQTTNRLSQVSRRGTFSEDVRMQSTPRKQLQFYNSCSDSKRDAHRLPASPAFRQMQRCSGECTHGEVEERDGHWDSIQHENQYHLQNDETLIQDLKLLTEATGPGVGLPEATGAGMVVLAGSTGREDGLPEETGPDAGVPEAMDLSALPEEVIYRIARRLAPSRRDVEALAAVCRHYRRAVPRTRGPWLILSPLNDGRPTVFLKIEQGVLVRQPEPMHPPPRTATCWSCCCGLMALRVQDERGFLLCVNCGFRQQMPHMPQNVELISVTATTQLVFGFSAEHPGFHWARHGEQGWHQFVYELAIEPKSMCWRDGIASLAAAPSTFIIDDPPLEHLNPAPGPIVIDFVVEMPPGMEPWNIRGHHVVHIGADTSVCILLRHDEDQHHVEVRLFKLHVDAHGNGIMLPANTIGNNAIFLGSNQAFATTAGLSITPNTAYVVDDDGAVHGARVLAIDLLTGEQHILLYPPEIGPADSFMPATWLGPLPDDELQGHCVD